MVELLAAAIPLLQFDKAVQSMIVALVDPRIPLLPLFGTVTRSTCAASASLMPSSPMPRTVPFVTRTLFPKLGLRCTIPKPLPLGVHDVTGVPVQVTGPLIT